jgi:chitin disaccharide deacetylase
VSSTPVRDLVLCADDFGMSAGVNAAILELIAADRLSATSCMTALPGWRAGAPALAELHGRAAVGLHLTLTEGPGAVPLGALMRASLLGRLPGRRIVAEIERQLDAFEAGLGQAPDFVDGHQHVHAFPGVRGPLITALLRRYGAAGAPWVRDPRPPLGGHDAAAKALVLRLMARGFGAALGRAGLRRSRHFAGLYSLAPGADFPRLMAGWLDDLPAGALVMCHPGRADDAAELAPVRAAEAAHLAGPRFAADLEAAGRQLVPRPALA